MALPSGYTQLKYIQSSGTQYIDTRYIPKSQKLRIVCDFTYVGSYSDRSIFGSEASSQYSICPYGAGPKFYVGTGKNVLSLTSEQGKDYVLDVTADNGTLTVVFDGATHTASYTGNLLATLSIYLFANNIAGVASQIAPLRVRSCKIYDNGTLVRDFVPAKNSSGTVGLYDTVNGVFYTNAGTGAFTEGPLAAGPVEGTGVSLIGGASFGINDGKCLVGGTAYAITEGKTLVGGTGYDVSFGPSVIPVTITGTGSSSYCYATINGTTYTEAASGMVVMPGDIITFYVYGASSLTTTSGYVEIDGTRALTVTNKTMKSYQWTVPEGLASINIELFITETTPLKGGRIFVTTTTSESGTVPVEITWSPNTGGAYSYVKINGTQYTENAKLTVAEGTVATIVCEERETTTKYWECTGYVIVNGSTVKTVYPGDSGTYTINDAVTIYMNRNSEEL